MSQQTTRRAFLNQAGGVVAGAFAAPRILPSRVFGANDRITIGAIGVKNQGSGNLKRFLAAGADVGAICDVDSKVAHAASATVQKSGPKCSIFTDYRELLDQQGIDAVVVTTPDHWHALMTIDACKAGKDVYCEKPLSLTIAEGRRMVNAAREHKRVVQTGSQQRSSSEFRTACMLVRNGFIGDVQEILVGIPDPNHPGALGPDETVPPELNYDMWLGPAPLYQSKDHTRNFLDCMRSRELPICDVEIGHRSATVCHLANLVARLGRPIQWDPKSESVVGDNEAQALTDKEYRAPWKHA